MPPGIGMFIADFCNIALFVFSLFYYIRERKKIDLPYFKTLERLFIIFLIYFGIVAFNSETTSQYGKITNIRALYPLFLFFSTIAFITTKKKLEKLNKYFIIIAVIGALLAIFQSIKGIEPLFDKDLFYAIGHWEGQQHMIAGTIARVMLPTLYLIYIVFISIITYQIVFKDHKYSLLLILFIMPILIGYARSQWVAILVSVLIIYVYLMRYRSGARLSVLRNITILGVIIFSSFLIIGYIFGDYLKYEILERAIQTYSDIYEQSGTFGSRLQTLSISLTIWSTSPYFGKGIYYWQFEGMPELSDIGFTYVMVTIGIIGLILFSFYFIANFILGLKIIQAGRKVNNKQLIHAGTIPFMTSLLFLISQHYTQHDFTLSLLALSTAYAVVVHKLNRSNINSYFTL